MGPQDRVWIVVLAADQTLRLVDGRREPVRG
jgi:hypothetical protein